MKDQNIHSVAIYPPIGVARVGNSKQYYLASDVPGVAPQPRGGFKDGQGRVKKQAVRFRLYGFNKKGEVVKEITDTRGVSIDWRVHVANIKAAWYQFNNALDLGPFAIAAQKRNSTVAGADREDLVIDPGSISISGKNKKGRRYHFDDGEFYGNKVYLGELQTDDEGRLIFLGGNGHSASDTNAAAVTFANNDGWHDDTSDGVVRATVKIKGKKYEATPAMVAVTPPDFGPGLYGVVTMNDVVENLFINEFGYPNRSAAGVEFYRDIYPMLQRMTDTQWVNSGFFMLFGKNSPSDFTDPALVNILSNPSKKTQAARKRVFDWFRDPASTVDTPAKVPPFYGDGFGDFVKVALDNLPITPTQYARLKEWAKGNFTTGSPAAPKPFDKMSLAEQLNALNQAPLEECLGGPFHPGIELTWPLRQKIMWEKPYRLKMVKEGQATQLDFGPVLNPGAALGPKGPLSVSGPGALTRWLGVPWQTDEASCLSGYTTSYYLPLPSFWAARVPNQVLSEDSYRRMEDGNLNIAQRLKHFDLRQDWLRDFGTVYQTRINDMVADWHELGIIAPKNAKAPNNTEGFLPEKVWKETGRHFTGGDPTFKQVLYAENAEPKSKLDDMASPLMLKAQSKPKRTRRRKLFGRGER
ncbi:MAG: hypothetical protein HEP71_25990 [Roseivirga sp.]|nr:hypothetical protein [Roseivirga sp.]